MKAKRMNTVQRWALYDPVDGRMWKDGERLCIYGTKEAAKADAHTRLGERSRRMDADADRPRVVILAWTRFLTNPKCSAPMCGERHCGLCDADCSWNFYFHEDRQAIRCPTCYEVHEEP